MNPFGDSRINCASVVPLNPKQVLKDVVEVFRTIRTFLSVKEFVYRVHINIEWNNSPKYIEF